MLVLTLSQGEIIFRSTLLIQRYQLCDTAEVTKRINTHTDLVLIRVGLERLEGPGFSTVGGPSDLL